MTSGTVKYASAPPIAELVLDHQARRNALSLNMWQDVSDHIARAENDPAVKVILIHGGDSAHFAAGADISEFATHYATPEGIAASGRIIAEALDAIERCPKPVIAAIDGSCVGGGVSLAMAADIRMASSGARFAITPARLGLVYPAGDTRRLLAAIGPGAAKDLLFSARQIGADDALAIRLIDQISSATPVIDDALGFAHTIAANSQWSTRTIKSMIAGLQSGWTDQDVRANALFIEGFQNADYADGARAFLEKRAPIFDL